jgi:branched-chain amino acid transport system permease protein
MLELLIAGISLGSIYALAALGFIMIYNATSAVNFAHGELVVLGGFLGVSLFEAWQVPTYLLLILVPVLMLFVGVGFEFIGHRPLQGRPFTAVFTSTMAIGIIISSSELIAFGPQPRRLPSLREGLVELGSIRTPWQDLFIILTMILLVLFQRWLFSRTMIGYQLRATAQDPVAAQLVGIRVRRMMMATFALASAYAGVAGVLLAPVFFVTTTTGLGLILKIYIAVVIGGFGSLVGGIIGGVGLGVLEVFTSAYISSAYRDAIIFGILFLFLLVRPQGILGRVEARV